ncbi:hypothetical protein [Escherichia albertii]|uniref:hypothetical protein n=1 Tax=Escherichia albertii TaxID=208962 RepID=UPI0011F05DB8|nr:hypothetical protein [Escherichia albertii]
MACLSRFAETARESSVPASISCSLANLATPTTVSVAGGLINSISPNVIFLVSRVLIAISLDIKAIVDDALFIIACEPPLETPDSGCILK